MNQEQEHNQVSQSGQQDPKPEGFVKEVARDQGKEFVSETVDLAAKYPKRVKSMLAEALLMRHEIRGDKRMLSGQ